MTQKIEKVVNEITKTRQKIAELQQRVEELEKQQTDLENTEIIQICRSADIPLTEIAGFLRSCKDTGGAIPRPAVPLAAPASANYGGGGSGGSDE